MCEKERERDNMISNNNAQENEREIVRKWENFRCFCQERKSL